MSTSPLRIAAVVFPQFELLDLFGPLELFGVLKERTALSVCALEPGEVASTPGPRVVATEALAEIQAPDVLLVPGGIGTRREMKNERLLGELRRLSAEARLTCSVCTGSLLLASTGVLDGRRATTNKRAFDLVAGMRPAVQWVRRARWVEDGSFFTSSGVSAGMDMALAAIHHLLGPEAANESARIAEYTWHRDSTDDPFANP